MSIASRISAMQEHLRDDYDVLNLAGADLTNVDKNIVNLKPSWKERLLYFMNNGTDVVWNNWDKVTGEGEEISLNNTLEAKMKIRLKGNTYQETTTQSANLFDEEYYKNTSYDVSGPINYTSLKIKGGRYLVFKSSLKTGKTAVSGLYMYISSVAHSTTGETIYAISNGSTITRSLTFTATDLYLNIIGNVQDVFDNYNVMVATTDTAYVPFVPNSPNPDYPQDIHVVSGDNSIEVSNANLFDKEYYSNSSLYSIDGAYKNTLTKIEGNRKLYSKCILKEGKTPISNLYMCICSEKHPNVSGAKPLWLVNGSVVSQSSFNFTGYNNLYFTFYPSSLTPTQIFDTYNIMVSTNDVDYVEYKGTSYPISLGDIELCKIGDYQDKIAKSTGKNLFDKDSQDILENVRIGADGGNNADSGYFISEFIEVTPNTKYTKNTTADAYHRFAFYTDKSTNSFISKSENNTITTPSNAKYLRICGLITELDNVMLNEGSTALPYEPYGIGWYVKKEIGKVILDNSTILSYNGTAGMFYGVDQTICPNYKLSTEMLCNYLSYSSTTWVKNCFGINANNVFWLYIENGATTLADLQTWLGTNKPEVFYILKTPTYTLIEDSTLINQLETIKKSYEGQTNIAQENNDMPFILDITALKEM